MKNQYRFMLLSMLLSLFACNKLEEPVVPEFSVSTTNDNKLVGEPVIFNFQGAADYISFYSGEEGSDYAYKDGRVKNTKYFIIFRTERRTGDQLNQFSLHVSTDYNGTQDYNSINNATWVDITDRITLAPKNDFSVTQRLDVTDLIVEGKPLYFGWRYVVKNPANFGSINIWRFRDFSAEMVSEDGLVTAIATQTSPSWKIFSNVSGFSSTNYNVSSTRVTFNHNAVQTYTGTDEVYWAINTKAFTLTPIVDFGPDLPISLKSYADNPLTRASHVYNKPGNYEAVFIGVNANVKGLNNVVKKVKIEVK